MRLGLLRCTGYYKNEGGVGEDVVNKPGESFCAIIESDSSLVLLILSIPSTLVIPIMTGDCTSSIFERRHFYF